MSEDEQPPASVSSLRSRFEQLATTTTISSSEVSPSAPSQHVPVKPRIPEPPPRPLRASLTGHDPFGGSRATHDVRQSSDASRDSSPDHTGLSPEQGSSFRNNTVPRGMGYNPKPRPVSVYSTFPPQKAPPALRVESPRSPPPKLNLERTQFERTPLTTGLVTPSVCRPPPMPGRPLSPGVPPPRSGRTPPPPPPPPSSRARPTSMIGPPKSSPPQPSRSEPPPVPARNTKPKIPGRPTVPPLGPKPGRPDYAGPRTPALAPAAIHADRVSPFSTPPSSANTSPSRSEGDSPARSLPQPGKLVLPPAASGYSLNSPAIPRRETYHHDEPELPPRNPYPPPRMSMDQVRPKVKIGESLKAQRMSTDDAGSRPELPPRSGGLIGGIKARIPSRGRSHSPPKTNQGQAPVATNFLPPPQRARIGGRGSSPGRQADGHIGRGEDTYLGGYGYGDDSDDEGIDDQSGLSDYPDSSQANRRRPYFKDGLSEIVTKTDVKMFAVCGHYVCTISHSTKVWDIRNGRCIMAIQHGEGVKITALAFKPSYNVEDEGKILWIGSQHGELMEVDIPQQRVVETRTSAHTKKEVVKIHRSGFDLWTLDSGGKLQVWSAGTAGTPNLRNSPTTFRIHPRHTCSIVVNGDLWVGHGKAIDVYRPSGDPAQTFNVSGRQLTPSRNTGDITCAAIINSQPDKVYFGHSDGSVSIYSRSTLQCVEVVSVSLYKINSMTGVGDYLWAGFKTGMMYVYDTRSKPWRALKDWECSGGPINEVIADRTSIWMNGRLQVVTLGADNIIRIWDGMMEEDWLEAEMQKNDAEFCNFRTVNALVCSWNAGATKPQDLLARDSDRSFLQDVLKSTESPPEIVVFGFQELVDLEDKKITAKSFLKGSKKKRAADQQEHMSHQYRLWQQQLTKTIGSVDLPKGDHYVLLHVANLVGLFTCMFVRASERDNIRNVSAASIKRGLGGLHGNKGAIVVRFLLDDSSLCFINCHLAAGQSHTISRNNDIAAILEASIMPAESSAKARTDMFVGGGDGSMILDHEICILNGDLNYRIDISRESAVHKVKQNDLAPLLERDQLLVERRKNPGFRLRVFNEASITFAPTYKYDVGTDIYDTSEKKRVPAWCDRVLYRGRRKIEQTQYRRWEVKASDHRPVTAAFNISVKTVERQRRKMVWERCCKRYEAVRQKCVLDAKMDYLVNVCGYGTEEARRTLERKEDVIDAVASLEKQQR
ncbi:DNase I-like protein [Ascodesmis nigricans]|uniref:DNase I-like protein n=1 Tax=Ascodesmis nigricans TaxID=341454 RepID=A0A4S2MJL1_9PEZI|nr:DNase I-like protein [Ascodesmis nigricans]